MKKLFFATSNKWKFGQADVYFRKKGLDIQQLDIKLPESRSEEVLEVAKEKLDFAFQKIKSPVFVIDAAFHIKGLRDFPKTYVKFVEKYIGAEGVIELLKGKKNRRWEFPNVLYYKDSLQEKYFIGLIKGRVVQKLSHSCEGKVRDFDRIQIPDGYTKTFAEMSENELRRFDKKVWQPTVFDNFIDWYKKNKIISAKNTTSLKT